MARRRTVYVRPRTRVYERIRRYTKRRGVGSGILKSLGGSALFAAIGMYITAKLGLRHYAVPAGLVLGGVGEYFIDKKAGEGLIGSGIGTAILPLIESYLSPHVVKSSPVVGTVWR